MVQAEYSADMKEVIDTYSGRLNCHFFLFGWTTQIVATVFNFGIIGVYEIAVIFLNGWGRAKKKPAFLLVWSNVTHTFR